MTHKREWDRHPHQIPLFLELAENRRIVGYTRDVSMGGLFLAVEHFDVPITAGETGILRLVSGETEQTFPCQVIRVTGQGVALALTDLQARFGLAISHDIFHGMISERKG